MKKLFIVGASITATAIVASNAFMMFKMNEIVTEVNEIKDEVKGIKEEVSELQQVVMYNSGDRIRLSRKEQECLVKNVYHEAGVEPFVGKIAVAQVTFNRLNSGRWGNDVCKVVYAKSQFSWTLSKKKKKETPKGDLWKESVMAVNEFKNGTRISGIENSGFYHTDWISQPKWAKNKQVVLKVGQHLFYDGVDS